MTGGERLRIGTCSWKYDSWRGLIYPAEQPINYLREYSRYFPTVEVDQWFWSLFKGDAVVLPKAAVVREYADSVPEHFTFCIKIPNSITLTHHYTKQKITNLRPNPHFLSVELMERFLRTLDPLAEHLGPLVFQFEYLNKQKMAHLEEFLDRFGAFVSQLPKDFLYCVETRNPHYLKREYFDFLASHNLHHVFLQGYHMPSIFELHGQFREQICDLTIIRLHGSDRKGIEEQTAKNWSRIVAPKDHEIEKLSEMLADLSARHVQTYLYVNNHYEGSAPRTIARIEDILHEQQQTHRYYGSGFV